MYFLLVIISYGSKVLFILFNNPNELHYFSLGKLCYSLLDGIDERTLAPASPP